jgi:hypothetical protein
VTAEVVRVYIDSCEECSKRVTTKSSKRSVNPIMSNGFGSRGQVDLVDMQANPDEGYKYIGNYQDHFSKLNILFPLKSKTAAEVALALFNHVFSLIGAPAILQSDNGKEFRNKLIRELILLWPDCKMVHGRARHPQSQGSVEKSNDTLQRLLGTWMRESASLKWAVGIKVVQFQMNSVDRRAVGGSSFQLVFGRAPACGMSALPLDKATIDKLCGKSESALLNILQGSSTLTDEFASSEDELLPIEVPFSTKLEETRINCSSDDTPTEISSTIMSLHVTSNSWLGDEVLNQQLDELRVEASPQKVYIASSFFFSALREFNYQRIARWFKKDKLGLFEHRAFLVPVFFRSTNQRFSQSYFF